MTSAVPSLPNPNISGTYRPPTSPKFAKNTSPKISPQPLSINQVQPKPNMGQAQYGLNQMDQISPKSIAISQQAASSAAAAVQAAVANSQIAAAVQQQVKVAEVSIPIKRPPHQRVSG